MRRAGSPNRGNVPMSDRDDLLDAARERAGDILMFYKTFAEKKPVMLLELPSQKIYAYPYLEFKNTLSERSQKMLEKEYQDAAAHNQIVVFVKDNDRRKMISFSVDEE
jgi:hypothetical protein